ncbi:unnamed protein product [Acanthoscelides obtectus]|uniref:Uncharacterized protein n=1 Tax=Acanthoscelides obtectus TaxID=200917 RepID=A0A9P0MK23_ACAOB|nr:unnamed protein product [Acanthoscelides obtectus]CAK1669279.1 hypothetical protein AOBTE_LOCUS26921 [Acanthoscelides obtectus]
METEEEEEEEPTRLTADSTGIWISLPVSDFVFELLQVSFRSMIVMMICGALEHLFWSMMTRIRVTGTIPHILIVLGHVKH